MDVLVSASPTFVFYLQPKFGDNFFLVFIHTHNLIFQKYSVCCVQDLLSGFICITLILGRAADPQSVVDVLLRLLSPKGFLPQPKF